MTLQSPASTTGRTNPLCLRHEGIDALLISVGVGDRDAFAALYDEMSQTVYAMSLHRGNDAQRSAQLTQDVFLALWQRAGTFSTGAGSAWAWVRGIAQETIDRRTSVEALTRSVDRQRPGLPAACGAAARRRPG